jgi:Cu(I)/Ag(I) efflux system membrane fusion protein
MNQQAYKKSFVIGAVAIGVITGIGAGFFTAHRVMGDMADMTKGTGGVSPPPGSAETGDMKQMEMKGGAMQGMPGMAGTPSGAVVVPAVARQLIGVRSASVAYATLTQEIRAVGTVGYD